MSEIGPLLADGYAGNSTTQRLWHPGDLLAVPLWSQAAHGYRQSACGIGLNVVAFGISESANDVSQPIEHTDLAAVVGSQALPANGGKPPRTPFLAGKSPPSPANNPSVLDPERGSKRR